MANSGTYPLKGLKSEYVPFFSRTFTNLDFTSDLNAIERFLKEGTVDHVVLFVVLCWLCSLRYVSSFPPLFPLV